MNVGSGHKINILRSLLFVSSFRDGPGSFQSEWNVEQQCGHLENK